MLVIEPRNGLANRLRAIDSGIALAKILNKRLVVDWILNEDLNCRFDKLFEPIDGLIMNDGIKLPYPFKKHLNLHYFFKSLRFDISFDSISLRSKLNTKNYKYYDEDFGVYLKKYNKIFITTGEFFYHSIKNYYYFKPKTFIINAVDEMCNNLGTNFIGIHIRRVDNKNAILYSPNSLFMKTIDSILEEDVNTKFFLSTDSKEEEILFKQSFPANIFTYSKNYNRNEEKGVQDALVDLLCLSKAEKIFGSYYSSFSEAATYFSGNNLIILRDHNKGGN